MRLLRHLEQPAGDCAGGVVTIGNFDGFHRGHQQVLARAAEKADALAAPLVVLTMEPHPRAFFRPEEAPFRLTPLRAKAGHFTEYGIDCLYVLPFDGTVAAKSAEDFVREVLNGGLKARHVVVGYDYRFGKGRGGSADTLRRMGKTEGFGVTVVGAVSTAGGVYSSTRIRQHLRQGEPRQAAELLGHWWRLEGRVIAGEKRGRLIGFPTANIPIDGYLHPALGVYAVRVSVETTGEESAATVHDGVANIGTRPTFDDGAVVIEAHLLDDTGDLYGRHISVELVDFLRPEVTFSGLDALKEQIGKDCETARRALSDPANARQRFAPPRRP